MADAPVPASRLRSEPLWVRVDRNRLKLAVFVTLFVVGSAALLSLAMVGVPATLFSAVLEWPEPSNVPAVVGGAFALMLLAGALLAFAQLANADDWVRNRLGGRPPAEGEGRGMLSALGDMALAAGLPSAPRLMVVPSPAVNAFALGSSRGNPVVGVTDGFLAAMNADEQRAVAAALVARIVSGDILFGTALAALMGPLKAFRDLRMGKEGADTALASCASDGCSSADGCDGCGSILEGLGDSDDSSGCGGMVAMIVFLVVVAVLTYVAVRVAAWIVTLWGRLLHRTGHEKADAEGMLLLKHPEPMVSALAKALEADNTLIEGDPSYDGIFYTSTTGRAGLERAERKRLRRLCEVLGVEGAQAWDGIG